MANFSDSEQRHLTKFFQENVEMAISLAKVVTRSTINATNIDDAIDIILQHSTSVQTILNRRIITKEILFSYLHRQGVSITNDFTKATLIDHLLNFWKTQDTKEETMTYGDTSITPTGSTTVFVKNVTYNLVQQNIQNTNIIQADFAINKFAKDVADWFFNHFNSGTLESNFFWPDATAVVRMIDVGNIDNFSTEESTSAGEVSQFLNALLSRYNVKILASDSVGRIHDYAPLVLTCGVLQTNFANVGTFESALFVKRDPVSNGYCVKKVCLQWKNDCRNDLPALSECESIAPLLQLAITGEEEY